MNKRSSDDGLSWVGGFGNDIHGLWSYGPAMHDPDDPNVVHVCNVDQGHAYSTDLGATWHAGETDRSSCDGIGYDPNNPDIWYKIIKIGHGGDLAIRKAKNRGRTMEWVTLDTIKNNGKGYMGRIIVDPSDKTGKTIYVSDRALSGIYMSTDGGYNFSMVREHLDVVEMWVTKAGNVYAHSFTAGQGLSRFIKKTGTWSDIAPGRDVNGFAVHPADENIMYMNAGIGKEIKTGKLYKTTSGLSDTPTWEEQGGFNGWVLYIDTYRPEYMLMATVNYKRDGKYQGVMRSSDAGKSWKRLETISPYNHVWGFSSGGPAAPGRVLSATATAGLIDDIYDGEYRPKHNVNK
jgi:hypothetical protein